MASREYIGARYLYPYPRGGAFFRLFMWDTNKRDSVGKPRLQYRLCMYENGTAVDLFEGDDFYASPMHAIDSDDTFAALLSFLTLRPGDTDAEYFEHYTEAQRAFCEKHAEALSMYAIDRFGER